MFSYSGPKRGLAVSALSGNDQYLAAPPIMETVVELMKLPSGDIIRKFEGLTKNPVKLIFSDNNKYILAYTEDNHLSVWNVDSGKQLLMEKMKRPHQVMIINDSVVVKRHDKSVKNYRLNEIKTKTSEVKS